MVKKNRLPLTESQAQVFTFIRETVASEGVPPSYREIQEHFGYKAVGTVQDHVKALMKKGYLEKPEAGGERRARRLMPAEASAKMARTVPIYGEVAAGNTRQAEQIELGSILIGEGEAKEPCFALRVQGDSMIDVGIFEGDVLLVEKNSRVKNGDIVVALLDGETTVKRLMHKSDGIWLQPENRRLKPIPTHGKHLEIQGKVVGLRRQLT